MSWKDLETAQPELAAYGAERFQRFEVAYLATVRADGSPRVHPVTPIVGQGRLFLFMEPTSPKGHDLRRDGRYALHCSVSNSSGESGEFFISGRATFIDDPAVRELAVEVATYTPADRYILFELDVESASSTTYTGGQIVRQRWKAADKAG
jgi:Pyridoxamine 5'-phosphate oxidase